MILVVVVVVVIRIVTHVRVVHTHQVQVVVMEPRERYLKHVVVVQHLELAMLAVRLLISTLVGELGIVAEAEQHVTANTQLVLVQNGIIGPVVVVLYVLLARIMLVMIHVLQLTWIEQ